ncbi:hypothetical protein [Mycobacterium asiaticum]|uniref:DUF983 domain-containing protein n=1 Tax=Mycobacterium asiaticum TaxID=1790 RepID=A0A1A3MX52_MYCAS|nr:hypothetical protein [Mycobacterium asiaticum]OBK14106.1 hypothetical protein A5635_10460 [Mycobacterium asiaticum]
MHHCPRCGFESRTRTWPERHPYAAALAAIPTIWTLVSVTLAYPWFFVPVLIVAAAVWVDRRQKRRTAILARADHDHRKLMARAVFGLRRPRGADHWSPTQPIRAGRN